MKKNNWGWPVALIVICMGVVLAGGLNYVSSLRSDLMDQATLNVLTVTKQQQQAIDTFIAGDRERLHSFAEYFARNDYGGPEEVQQQLTIFNDVDAFYSVIDLNEGWLCYNGSSSIYSLSEENLDFYEGLSGSGVRDAYTSVISGNPKFGYYEVFSLTDGHKGIIQKSYDRSVVSETFSLSFYNDRGFAYVVDRNGNILVQSDRMMGGRLYDNIFEILSEEYNEKNALAFEDALETQETGSMVFNGDSGDFVYTYVPLSSVEEWFLVSIVPVKAITEETDQILLSSQRTMLLLGLVLFMCIVLLLAMWHVQKNMSEKDRNIEYQKQRFDIFAAYLANSTNDVYIIVDQDTDEVEYFSPNVERVLGVSPERMLDLAGESDPAKGDVDYYAKVRALAPGEAIEPHITERVNPKTGEHKWFLENAYCTDIQGRSKRVVYISDRTKERDIHNTLREALEIAQTANRAKSTFLSSMSHDIRTPMNAIIGFAALLREEPGDPDVVLEYAQRIEAASQHLLGLINDVLDMNKIESGSATLNLAEMDLAELIDNVNAIIRPQTKAKNQTFEIFASPLTHEHLKGDKLRINQILINLLSNAVKYTQEGGDIQMHIDERAQVVEHYSRIRFTISDNGMGMSEDYQKVIFEPFTREESAVTRQIQGTGLGMAITKSLVDLMGGTISVRSTLGEGSVFTVELELYIQEREDDPRFWTEHGITRMIVADDDEDVCRNIARVMETTGVITDHATDGETAIRMMRENRENGMPYDLILLDWKMPDLDGLETARLIRKNYSEKIPILLLTAYDWGEIEQEAKEIGVNHFMPKPFFMTTFKEAIRRIMGDLKRIESEKDDVIAGRNILVVDDIEVNRIILVKILQTMGASCDVAQNGQEALKKFVSSRPDEYDIILMDVQMPVMDGYEATRAIRVCAHPAAGTVPIIAMTANAFVDDVRDAIDAGMDAHVAKPIQIDKLKETIGQVLASRSVQEN